MKSLTAKQRDALLRIRVVRDLWFKRFRESLAERDEFGEIITGPGASKPSEWISVYTLVRTHGIGKPELRALESKGFIERRYGGCGQGDEVRVISPDQ